jgi:hypothetical protein
MKSGKNERYFRKNNSKRNGNILQKLCNKLTKNNVGPEGVDEVWTRKRSREETWMCENRKRGGLLWEFLDRGCPEWSDFML